MWFLNKREHKIAENIAQLQINFLFDDAMLNNVRRSKNFQFLQVN